MGLGYHVKKLDIHLNISFDELAWYSDSPDTGDPACVCSYCNKAIPKGELCLRIANVLTGKEARLCEPCWHTVIGWVCKR